MNAPARKKLIEVSIPLEAINAESKRRKQKSPKGYPTSIHKYWAQRPVAACRSILFSQLVDDPSAWPERFEFDDAKIDHERRRLHRVMERLVPWEASNDIEILNAARWEIARSVAWGLGEEPPAREDGTAILSYLQAKAPSTYDPFSGGASIPLESQRLGLRSHGSDLNPVAVLIGKALVEVPAKFAGRPPVNPDAQAHLSRTGHWNSSGAQGLADDVRFYGQWMRNEAEKRIGYLYPQAKLPDGSNGTVVAWIWARTLRSPDPSAQGAMVPLVTSFLLSTKEGRKVWLEPVDDPSARDGYRFEIRTGALSREDEARLKAGTKAGRGANFTCLKTGSAIPADYVKQEGVAGRYGLRLLAMVVEGASGRAYLAATPEQEAAAASESPAWSPSGDLPDDPRSFWAVQYGLTSYASLFTDRQLVSLGLFSELVAEAGAKVLADAQLCEFPLSSERLSEGGLGARAYADAVMTYLAFAVDRMATYGSSLCKWLTKDNALAPSIPLQGIAMSYDFAEGNPLAKSSASVTQCISVVAACVENATPASPGYIGMSDARTVSIEKNSVIATDPPYYDNIPYADCSDFFYVWMKRSLSGIWPDLFRRLQTPKDEELVATPYRHGGADQAQNYFMSGMKIAIKNIFLNSSDEYPATIFYAFKQTENDGQTISSKGWASFLQAIVDSDISIDGTWPLRTELTSALKNNLNSLASSVVLVCRKRGPTAATITSAEFIRALKQEMPAAIDAIRKAGVGPVDMQQSVIGPGMGVFSRYSKVLEDDDSVMLVGTALSIINRVWGEIENELDSNFDPETQVALAWYADYGFDARSSGELITLANAKNTASNALFSSGVFTDFKGKAALTERDALPIDWTPAGDKHLTVWECVQHTARVLNAPTGGARAAANLVAQMGPKADDARALAYRLFEIATQKARSTEALIYNELAQEWTHLEDLAVDVTTKRGTSAQGTFEFA